jgi:3-isopropylmalate dehydrogenase
VDRSMEEGIVTEDIAEGKAYLTSEVGDWLAENL